MANVVKLKSARTIEELFLSMYPKSMAQPKITQKKRRSLQYSFEQGKAYFERNRNSLVSQHLGKYVAIWNDEVLDTDKDFSSLAERVYRKLGYVPLYMPFVSVEQPDAIIHSPKIGKV